MADGALFKPEKDFTKEADKVIPEAEALAKQDIQKGIDRILVLEKQARQVCKQKSAVLHEIDMPTVFRSCYDI